MLLYRYEAISNNGKKINGSTFAPNYRTAYKCIHLQKNYPLTITPIPISPKKITVEDLLIFFLHIDLQLKCKVKINDAIESFLQLHGNKILKSSLAAVLIDLRNGASLGEAFEKCRVFDSIVIGLIKSSEQTGKISDIISNVLKFLKLRSEWKNSIKRAIAYPIFITCIAILVLVLSVALLGPQVSSLIQNVEAGEISALTRLVIEYFPQIFEAFAYFIPIVLLTAILFIANENVRIFMMNRMLRVPKIGLLIVKICFWQICKILHIALEAKLDFINAMDIAIKSVKIRNIKDELLKAREKIIDGYSISMAFAEAKFVSMAAISAFDIGEESGNLSASFAHMSDSQYEEIILDIKSLGQFLTVGLTFFTGAILILIICGLFFPIYSYIEVAGA